MNPAYLRPIAIHIVQSTLFAAAAALLTLALSNNRARIRHTIWLIASCKFLIPISALIAFGSQFAPPLPPQKPPATLPVATQQAAESFTIFQPPPPLAGTSASPIPNLLLAIWGCGFAAIGLSWYLRWLRIRATVHNAAPLDLPLPIPVKTSPAVREPSVFGVFRPVLLLPEGILRRLTPSQLQAVIAHELCHARYGDNLSASLHMFVETVFWFHPLVWWLGKRMIAEREQACDEDVLARGNDPDAYAEAIFNVCRFCLEAPLPFASSIGGSDLRRRIAAIVTPRGVLRLHPLKKLTLAALAVAAVTCPLAIGLAQQPPAPMSFDVVSVKPYPGYPSKFEMQRSGGRIRWTATIMSMVMYAYRIQAFQETGMAHVPYDFFAVDAETTPGATDDQLRLMFQSLLAARFKFQAHRETRQLAGYALAPAKGGVKIQPTPPDAPPAPLPEWFAKGKEAMSKAIEGKVLATMEGRGITAITARRTTIAQLVQTLEDQLRAPVLDRTGLTGQYYFGFKCVRVDAPPEADADPVTVPTLFAALRQSLGLQLEKQTVPVDMLIVDHVDNTPTGN